MRYFPRDFALGTMCMRDYLMWRENNHAFEDPSLFTTRVWTSAGMPEFRNRCRGAAVTAGFFFHSRCASANSGRTFAPGEDKPASASLVVLSESIWRRRFGANSSVLGQSILVNARLPP